MATNNVLPGWGYYLGNEVDSANVNNKYGQQFLNDIQKYDPNAHWEVANQYGGSDGGATTTMMRMVYDKSKLPGGDRPAMVDMNPGAYAGFRDDPNAGYRGHLYDQSAISEDPNGYGLVTSPRNLNIAADDAPDWVAKYAPMIIASIATMGAAAPALMAGEGLFSSLAGAGTLGSSLTTALPSIAGAADRGDWLSVLSSLGPGALGLAGVDPSVINAIKYGTTLDRIYQQYQQQQRARGGG
jgi:hypothetical protein